MNKFQNSVNHCTSVGTSQPVNIKNGKEHRNILNSVKTGFCVERLETHGHCRSQS